VLALCCALAFAGGCASDAGARARSGGGSPVQKLHTVARGENLYRIGQRYGVSVAALRRANDIDDVTKLRIGMRLRIPPAATEGRAARARVRAEVKRAAGTRFVWPVQGGQITSRFGRRHGSPHEGIDIAAPRGTPIRAAEAGKVIFAGRLGDYGKLVIVKHSGNLRSVYAHLRRYRVSKGAFVERGQRIADVGATGNASGPHLHFEIRDRDRPRDPILYLP